MSEADTADDGLAARLAALEARIERLTRLVEDIHAVSGPFGLPMPNGAMLVQTIHKIKYLIDPRDLVMTPQLVVYRQWEPELSALFNTLLTPDSVVVDVGANFGYFTCLAGARIGVSGTGRVFAVEPNPHLARLLRANAAINWSMCPIAITEAAAGPAAGRAILSIPTDGAANASLSSQAGASAFTTAEVDVVELDALVPTGVAVDLLKIDVEGHETGVLMGARRILRESPAIRVILEWSLGQMSAAGYPADELLALIADLDLAIYEAPADGRAEGWRRLDPETLLRTAYANILLSRPPG